MLTLKPIKAHASAFEYYTKDNQFTLEEGMENSFWHGQIAEHLGLSDKVHPDDLQALFHGQLDGTQLGRMVNGEVKHRPGDDLTFSAPKSLSLLAEVYQDQTLIDAHNEAVKATLDYIEKHYIVARVTEQKVTQSQVTGKAAFAVLRHDTSRELDPMTHSHALLMNATEYGGQYRSVDPRAYYPHVKQMGHLYRLNLTRSLEKKGVEYEITNEAAHFIEIKGIGKHLIDNFSKRSQQIRQYMKDRNLKYHPSLAQRISLITRREKQEVSRETLRDLWKSEVTSIDPEFQYDLEAVNQSRQQRIKEQTKEKPLTLEEINKTITRAVRRIQTVEMSFTQDDLMKATSNIMKEGNHDVEPNQLLTQINAFTEKRLVPSEIPAGISDPKPYFTTKQGKKTEKGLITQLKKNAQRFDAYLTEDQINQVLNRFHNKPKPKNHISLDAGQRQAIIDTLTTKSQFHFIQGNAGAGKTTMLKELRAVVKRHHGELKAFAPSHIAVKELEKSLGIESYTLDHFLTTQKKSSIDVQPTSDKPEIWIIDEASLIGLKNFKALADIAERQNAKVVLVGDQNQLESVGAGRGVHLATAANISTSRVSEIYRQQNPELKAVAEQLNSQDFVGALNSLSTQGHIQQVGVDEDRDTKPFNHDELPDGENTVTLGIMDHLKQQPAEKIDEQVVIVPTNADRDFLNQEIRDLLKEKGRITGKEYSFITLESKLIAETDYQYVDQYKVGETIRFNRKQEVNQTGWGIAIAKPGEYFTISGIAVDRNELVLKSLDDGRRITFNPKALGDRPQGALFAYEEKEIQVSEGDSLRWLDNRNEYGLKRNDRLRVTKVTPREIQVKHLSDNNHKTINIAYHKLNNRHFEHQHALTTYASQGITEDHVIVAAHSWRRNTVNQRSLLVGGTRAKHSLTVFTDDLSELMGNIQQRTGDNTRALLNKELKNTVNVERDLSKGLGMEI